MDSLRYQNHGYSIGYMIVREIMVTKNISELIINNNDYMETII
jgi:hypothetical protein